jgi:hypothetical protein
MDMNSSEDLFLRISFIIKINLLLESGLGTIDRGVRYHLYELGYHCGYMA